jgi:DNA-3-methyladenine glycosylase I
MSDLVRCRWAVEHPELIDYHDEVWGVPAHDDRVIFAAYAQCVLHAGLLWTAMLRRREAFRRAFDDWDIARIAKYDGVEIDRLVHTDGMIRNFQKINAVIVNAGRFQEVQREFGSFDVYIWRYVDEPLMGDSQEATARRVAAELSVDLRRRGFKFAGEATAYGLMEDIGLINDHDRGCFRHG